MMERWKISVTGVVQGVGFRPFVYGLAARLGVRGHVANRGGDVMIEAEADDDVLAQFAAAIAGEAPAAARVDRIAHEPIATAGELGFAIAASAGAKIMPRCR
jgi:hydrogenase maturation protein HypF